MTPEYVATLSRLIYDLGNGQRDIALHTLLEDVLSQNTSFDDFEARRSLHTSLQPLIRGDDPSDEERIFRETGPPTKNQMSYI
jgi:hypothetical protein